MPRRLLAVLLLLVLAGLAACAGDDSDDESAEDPAPAPTTTVECTYADDGMDPAVPVEAPPDTPDVSGIVSATMSTTLGDFELTLDADLAPCTVNSFVSLARQGFFNDTTCHRLTTTAEAGIAVLQCGDPSGTGSGGPGYRFDDELSGEETYPPGTLAMANSGPDTNGSQFFIVYGETTLDPAYTVFGNVDDPTVKAITKLARKGTVPTDSGMTGPAEPVDIEEIVVR